MKLTSHRQRNRGRARAPRIAISQAEITADLNYRGERHSDRRQRKAS